MKIIHQDNLDEKFVSSKEGFSGRLLKVKVDTVVLPNGKESTREIIRHPGAVAIIPVLEDGRIALVKQYRYPIGTVLYEIPAGKLEGKEDHEACAIRELSEETGFEATSMEYLTGVVTTPGFTDEIIYLYVATGLVKKQQHTDEDEFIDIELFTEEKIKEMIIDEELFDSKSLSALLLYFLKKRTI